MEKRMKDYQTPQRDQAPNRKPRKPHKISKSLTAAFSSLSDEATSKEDFTPLSDLSNLNQISDIDTTFLQGVDPALSVSCESLLFPDLSPSSVVTFDSEQLVKVPMNFSGSNDFDEASAGSSEAEITRNSLRRALTQVLQSADVGQKSKKLIDASISIIFDDFLAIPHERRDQISQLISAKNQLLSLVLFLWIIVLALAFFYSTRVENSFKGPLPT